MLKLVKYLTLPCKFTGRTHENVSCSYSSPQVQIFFFLILTHRSALFSAFVENERTRVPLNRITICADGNCMSPGSYWDAESHCFDSCF